MGGEPVNLGGDSSTVMQSLAARLAEFTDVRDIRLMKTSAEIVHLPAPSPFLTYDLESEAAIDYEPGGGSFVIRGSYRVSITSAPPADRRRDRAPVEAGEPVARIEFEQAALFAMDIADREPPTPDELNAYAVTTGRHVLYPYAREYIADITMRLGLPSLTVGVLKDIF